MEFISKILIVITVLLPPTNSFAQIKNAETERVKIYGNCELCKATIERAGNDKKTANVEWNEKTKLATLTYDSDKTNQDEILKRIALAGYDNEKFLAPHDSYAKLPECCQYDRVLKPIAKGTGMDIQNAHSNHTANEMTPPAASISQHAPELKAVFDSYFLVKDALVKTDVKAAAAKATELTSFINAVDMNKLSAEEHTVWMKIMKGLSIHAASISKSKNVSKQRESFDTLSKHIYELAQVSKQKDPVYYQHCPMYNNGKGANWLSKENVIRNPYYGTQMLTCGSTVETIKQ